MDKRIVRHFPVKIKKLNLPYTNRDNYHQIDYNRLKGIKNHYSEFSFRSIKFNENYFIKNRHNYISKVHDNNSNKAKFNASYLNFLICFKKVMPVRRVSGGYQWGTS